MSEALGRLRRTDPLCDFSSVFRQVAHAREGGWGMDIPRFHLREYVSRADEELPPRSQMHRHRSGAMCVMRWPSGIRNPAPLPQAFVLRGSSTPNGPGRDRTCDLGIKSPLLYQLSYRPA